MRCPDGKKANSILLAVYLSFVLISQIVVNTEHFIGPYLVIGSFLAVIISACAAPFLISRFSALSLPGKGCGRTGGRMPRFCLYGIPLMILIFYYTAYYPGAFAVDSIDQYQQALTDQYNDWHPVLHTLIAFKLPMLVSGGWVGSFALFQILIFAVSLGYCFQTINQYAGKGFTVASMFFVLANPLTGNTAVFPWKDTAFAIGAMLLMTFSLQIFMTKGEWMTSWTHLAAFAAVFVVTTIVRHNAILFTIPLLFAVLFQISPKRFLILLLAIVSLFCTIKGPLYKALKVENPDKRQVETLGLPMTIIGAAVTYEPSKMDDEVLRFAYQIAPAEVWEKNYSYGNFNAVKWLSETDTDVIEDYGRERVIRMAFSCFKKAPSVCLKSLVKLTEGIYTITDPHPVSISPGIARNTYGISFLSPEFLRYLPNTYNFFVQDLFPRIFLFYGVLHLVVVISALAKSSLSSVSDWKTLLFPLPMFLYNYGTSLLLTGNDDSPRFFFYSVLLFPILLIFFYSEMRSE